MAASYQRLEEVGSGGTFEPPSKAASRMLFGQDIGSDARLAPLVVREHFLLSRLNPRRVTWATPIPVMWSQLSTARLLLRRRLPRFLVS